LRTNHKETRFLRDDTYPVMKTTKTLNTPTMDYASYMDLAERLVAEARTTGPNQSDAMVHYTKLNLKRMQRLNRSAMPSEALLAAVQAIPFRMRWVVITEPWCGDAAQNLPLIANTAAQAGNVDLHLVLRDENVEYMDQFLTNGTRSIPKLVMYAEGEDRVLGTWGPRPAPVQALVVAYKQKVDDKPSFEEFSTEIHQWYHRNANKSLESELLAIFRHMPSVAAMT